MRERERERERERRERERERRRKERERDDWTRSLEGCSSLLEMKVCTISQTQP